MSNIDYEELKKSIIDKIIEDNPKIKTEQDAKKKMEDWIAEYKNQLRLLGDDAILRIIANRKCNIQVMSIEEPEDNDEIRTLSSLEIPEYNLTIDVKVKKIRERELKNGKKIADLIISDGTAISKITLWEAQAREVENGAIKEGDIVRIIGAYTKESYKNYYPVEIGIGKKGKIDIDPDDPQIAEPETKFVSQLKAGDMGIHFTGKVLSIYEIRRTSRGNEWTSIRMSDKEGGSIFVKIWDQDILAIVTGPRVSEGDIITLTDLKVDEYKGQLGLNTTSLTELDWEDDEDPDSYPNVQRGGSYEKKSLLMAEENDRIEFIGIIVKVYPNKVYYDSCPNENCRKGITVRINDGQTEYFCERCNEVVDEPPVPIARITGLVSDGTGVLRFTAMGDCAEKIIGHDAERMKREFDSLYEASEEDEEWGKIRDAGKIFVENFEDRMMGDFFKMKASVSIDKQYRGNVELMINEMEDVDYQVEAQNLKTQIVELVEK